jgi:secernin
MRFRKPTEITQHLFSCDTLVARPTGGAPVTIFGKNSDRHCSEAQPLDFAPAAVHPPGAYVRCQYLTIPQVSTTHAVLGSRPWWLWGYEHGVNDAGVAIGNEAIYTRDEVQDSGLLGMDLVRLGLERGATAEDATGVIISLLEKYGQGGNAVNVTGFSARYHNSFIIADAREAFILETSARHWVLRRTDQGAAIGNLVTIEDDWDEASNGIETYARQQGWWWGPTGRRLNFRHAFEDTRLRGNTEDRYASSCNILAAHDEAFSVRMMMQHLRDHFESGTLYVPSTPDDPKPRSICCHPGAWASGTAASMVVALTEDERPPIAWCSMATPCTSVFLPVPVGAALPPSMTTGGDEEDDASLWWSMRRLAELVDLDPVQHAPVVQQAWSEWEAEILLSTEQDPGGAADALQARIDQLRDKRAELVELLPDPSIAIAG